MNIYIYINETKINASENRNYTKSFLMDTFSQSKKMCL